MAQSGPLDPEPSADGSDEHSELWDLPDDRSLIQIPDQELEELLASLSPGVGRLSPAERAARLDVDQRIVARVAADGYAGPNHSKLLWTVHQYAYPIIAAMLTTGTIFSQCARLGRPVSRHPADLQWAPADREFLTERSVDDGILKLFADHGLKRWTPAGGASLATFGVNACVLCFPRVYQQWWRGRVLEAVILDGAPGDDGPPAAALIPSGDPGPEERVVNMVYAEQLLNQMPQPLRTAMWWRGVEGYTQGQAAQEVGLTEKALEGQLGRFRKRIAPAPRQLQNPDSSTHLEEGL